jgi:hypothetical protein
MNIIVECFSHNIKGGTSITLVTFNVIVVIKKYESFTGS